MTTESPSVQHSPNAQADVELLEVQPAKSEAVGGEHDQVDTESNLSGKKEEVEDGGHDEDIEKTCPEGYRTLVIGVHRLIYSPPPPLALAFVPRFDITGRLQSLRETTPSVLWLLREMYGLSPAKSLASLSLDLFHALQPTASMYLSNRMLNKIEAGFKSHDMDVRGIAIVLGARFALSFISIYASHLRTRLNQSFKTQVQLHFSYLKLRANLAKIRGSLPDEGENEAETKDSLDIWRTANQLTGFGTTVVSAFSESTLMYKLLSGVSGSRLAPMMFAMWAVRAMPAFDSDSDRVWSQGFVSHSVNGDYRRMQAVKHIAEYSKQDILSLNLAPWIIKEFESCREKLRGIDMSSVWSLVWAMESPLRGIISDICDEWPTLYYAFSAMFGWTTFSFATISSVQSSSYMLRWKFAQIFGQGEESFSDIVSSIHDFHTAMQIPADPDDEAVPYPLENGDNATGMGLEFKNVSFTYFGSKAKKPAINNLSFSISPGQLIVIVGANGSGKTSLVKLLTRVHEPTSGTICVDGHPAQDFKRFDLREATASLSQDHGLFGGISIAEDVGLGRWKANERRDMVEKALRLGGAGPLLSKLKAGSDTTLTPTNTKSMYNGHAGKGGPLNKYYDKLEKHSSVSGGEMQRLVASRTFMRMYTGQIKLVVVDEPSSAMDPEGEFELFKHLREAREGKTMIFITHRFGHLTRHADAILCMKDGELVEQGTHAELVAKKGEYFNLYNIQAQAFASDVETLKPSETKKEGIEEDVNPSMEALARGALENITLDG